MNHRLEAYAALLSESSLKGKDEVSNSRMNGNESFDIRTTDIKKNLICSFL